MGRTSLIRHIPEWQLYKLDHFVQSSVLGQKRTKMDPCEINQSQDRCIQACCLPGMDHHTILKTTGKQPCALLPFVPFLAFSYLTG